MSDHSKMEPIEILLVEDNPGDVFLARAAMKSSKIDNRMTVVNDGQKAMDYLHKKNEFMDATRPDLILLDLNLPRKTGYEVLEEIKNDAHLRRIPVVILTSSEEETDIVRTYNLHANAYITKPVNLDQFITIVNSIEAFWFTVVKLPPV
jgi:two-component system, chemotaxis family, response regulator Rcp1